MAQKGLLIKKNNNVISKNVFAGDTATGIADYKAHLEGLNPSDTFAYTESDDTDASFTSATMDATEQATVTFE